MKLGLGLYRHMLTRDYYDFARQAGCTHLVVHLVDYFNSGLSNPRNNQPTGGQNAPLGVARTLTDVWAAGHSTLLSPPREAIPLVIPYLSASLPPPTRV